MSNVAVVTIGGSTVTSQIRLAGLQILDDLNQPKRCTFRMDTSAPSAGQEIKIGLGTTGTSDLIFAGVITGVAQAFEGVKANLCWDVRCEDYTYLLNRRYPIKYYTSQSATAIAQDLISSFTSGFTSANVEASLPSVEFACDGSETVMACLLRLGRMVACYVHIDFAKDLYFATSEASGSPDTLDGSNTTMMKDPPVTYDLDLEQVRTRVYVEGSSALAVANIPVGATILPLQSVSAFSGSGGSARTRNQRLAYTGISAGGAIAAPVGTWVLTPQTGGAGSLGAGITFTFKITYVTAAGETVASAASSGATTGGGSNNDINAVFTPTAGTVPTNITGFKMYVSNSTSGGAGPWVLFDFSLGGNAAMMSQLAAGGFAKDFQVVNNGAANPPSTSTAGIDEMFGSTTSGSTAVGATTITVVERGHFNSNGGVAVVTVNGTPFPILYTGKSSSYGTGSLTGVPASGFGSVLFTIATGTAIQNVSCLKGVSGNVYPIYAGDPVAISVQRDDTTAQTNLAALEGGDGIHEHVIQDGSLLSVTACNTRGDADLAIFKAALGTIRYHTRDVKSKTGKTVTVNLPSPQSISGTFKISRVIIDQVDLAAGRMAPRFQVEATNSRYSLEDLLRQLAQAA